MQSAHINQHKIQLLGRQTDGHGGVLLQHRVCHLQKHLCRWILFTRSPDAQNRSSHTQPH